MSYTMDYCHTCGRQVLGLYTCKSCLAKEDGFRGVPCRECGTLLVVSSDHADDKSMVCEPCTRYLLSEQMSDPEEFSHIGYDSPDGEDFWVRGIDKQAYPD
jgi:hypothetical protein